MDDGLRAAALRHGAPLVLIAAIAAAGLGFIAVHPQGLFNRHSDLIAENLATQTVLHDSWQSGNGLPLWRSDQFSGGPALTNPQSLYTHPLHALFALFAPERIVGLVIWLQMLVAAFGGYAAASVLRLSIPGRVLVAVAMLFSFKTLLAVYAGWLTVLAGIAAMPLFFAAVAALVEQPTRGRAVVAGLAGALLLHSGHPQLPFYSGLFVTFWAAARIVHLLVVGERVAAHQTLAAIGGAAVVAVGLAAYLLLPLALDARLVTRRAASFAFFIWSDEPWPIRGLLTVINPELYGTPIDGSFVPGWEFILYLGAASSVLAVIGVAYGRSRPYVPVLIAGLILSLALAVDTPLLRAAYAVVPGYSFFRLPARMLFVTAFFGCCLAGVGLDAVLRGARSQRTGAVIAAVLIAAVAAEGTLWARRYLRSADPIAFPVTADYIAALGDATRPARIAPMSRNTPSYGSAAPLGLQLVAGYDPFNLGHYASYMDVLRFGNVRPPASIVWNDVTAIARPDLLAALNVRFVVSPSPMDLEPAGYTLVRGFADQPVFVFYKGMIASPVYVYRNDRFLDRAFFVNDVRAAANADAMTREVEGADLRESAVVRGAEGGPSLAGPGDRLEILRATPGHLEIATRAGSRRFVVISEVWHPGWGARLDGQPVRLYQTDIALQGLWVPPGDHEIALTFWPPGLTAGLAVTAMTLMVVLWIAGRAFRRGHHQRGD